MTECYYEADGRTFQCTAPGRCTDAAQQLAAYCAGAYGGSSGGSSSDDRYYDDDGDLGPPGCALRPGPVGAAGGGSAGAGVATIGLLATLPESPG